MKRLMMSLLAILTCFAFATPAFAGTSFGPENYQLVLVRCDSIGTIGPDLYRSTNGYVIHVGDKIAAFVRGPEIGSYVNYTEPMPFAPVPAFPVGNNTSYPFVKQDKNPIIWTATATGLAFFQTTVWGYNGIDGIPESFGITTAIKVLPIPRLQATVLDPPLPTAAGGYRYGFYVKNMGSDTVQVNVTYRLTGKGIEWTYDSYGVGGKLTQVPMTATFGQVLQTWEHWGNATTWWLNTDKVWPGYLFGSGDIDPKQVFGVNLVVTAKN